MGNVSRNKQTNKIYVSVEKENEKIKEKENTLKENRNENFYNNFSYFFLFRIL